MTRQRLSVTAPNVRAAQSEPVLSLPEDTPPPVAWARPWAAISLPARKTLRAGAWYPVLEAREDGSAILIVRHRSVRVPARLLEIRPKRSETFSVVHTSRHEPNPAAGTRRDRGPTYAVCPASGHRIRITGQPPRLECPGCGYRGEIAWDEMG
jgi:hypothetical protein